MEHGAVSPDLLAATRKTLEALRSSDGDIPSAQLNLLARGLDALDPALSSDANAKGAAEGAECGREKKLRGPTPSNTCTPSSSWGALPEEILVQVSAAAVARSDNFARRDNQNFHETWWQARAVCRWWKSVFSEAFTDFDMGKRCRGPAHGANAARDGSTAAGFQVYKHSISDRAVFGAYGQWLADRFPNLMRIRLPPYNADVHDRVEFILHSIRVFSWIPATVNGLRPLRHLTRLEWGQCSPLDHATFEELSKLTTLKSLILNPEGRARGDAIHKVKEESLGMLTTLTNLRTLRVTMFENVLGVGRSTRAVAALTSLTNLTDIQYGCIKVHTDHLISLAAALPRLKILDLLPPGEQGIYTGDDGYSDITDESLMRLTTLKELNTLKLLVSRGTVLMGRVGGHRLRERMPELINLEGVHLPPPPFGGDEHDSDGDDDWDEDDSNSGYDSELNYSSDDPLDRAQR